MKEYKPYEELFDTYPLFRLVIPLIVGIGFGGVFFDVFSGTGPIFFLLSIFSVLMCVLVYCVANPHDRKSFLFCVFLNLSMASLGAGLIITDEDRLDVVWPDKIQDLKVMILDTPKETEKLWQMTAQITDGDFNGQKIRLVLMKSVLENDSVRRDSGEIAIVGKDTLGGSIMPGDRLLVHAKVSSPKNAGNPYEFDYAGWLRNQQVTGTAFCHSSQWQKSTLHQDDLPIAVLALRIRDLGVKQYERYFDGSDLGILAAMTLGDKTFLDGMTRDVFSHTGVSHILALSGMHLGILFMIYQYLVLSWCKRRWSYLFSSIIGICGLWVFVLLAGMPISLLRASIMFTLMQVLGCLRHDSFSINNLSLAALLLLMFSPMALFDVGFQLSFLSVFVLVLLGGAFPCPDWCSKNIFFKWVYGAIVAFFCAQLATAPLVAYYFHTFPLYGIIANLVAVPMTYVILAMAVLFLGLPFLQMWIAPVLGGMLKCLDFLLTGLSEMPGAIVELYPSALTVGLTYLFIICVFRYVAFRKVKSLYGAAALLMMIAASDLYVRYANPLHPQLIFYNLGRVPVVHAISASERSFLWSSDFVKADSSLYAVRRSFWKTEGLKEPCRLDGVISDNELYFNGRVLYFNGWHVALCYGRLPVGIPLKPIDVDYLLIAKGSKESLSHMLKYYHPKVVVLDASLTDYYREKYMEESISEKYTVYDIKSQGALRVS